MKKECGVTEISLNNAKELLGLYGEPCTIRLYYTAKDWYCVKIVWPNNIEHIFTGFSWGYYGEGCRGLSSFLNMVGINISVDSISSWCEKTDKSFIIENGAFHECD